MSALWLAGVFVAASPLEVAVVDIQVGDGIPREPLVAAVAQQIDVRPQLSMSSEEALFVAGIDEFRRSILSCRSSPPCLAGSLARLQADVAVLWVINASTSPAYVDGWVLDLYEQRALARLAGPVEPAEGSLSGAIRSRAQKLLSKAGWPPAAIVTVHAEPSSATLRWAGGRAPLGGNREQGWLLEAGTYNLEISAKGRKTQSRTLRLGPGDRKRLDVVLDEKKKIWGSPWFWFAVGGAVTTAGVAAGVGAATAGECVCVGGGCNGCPPDS